MFDLNKLTRYIEFDDFLLQIEQYYKTHAIPRSTIEQSNVELTKDNYIQYPDKFVYSFFTFLNVNDFIDSLNKQILSDFIYHIYKKIDMNTFAFGYLLRYFSFNAINEYLFKKYEFTDLNVFLYALACKKQYPETIFTTLLDNNIMTDAELKTFLLLITKHQKLSVKFIEKYFNYFLNDLDILTNIKTCQPNFFNLRPYIYNKCNVQLNVLKTKKLKRN
jgi:hypothetical protein